MRSLVFAVILAGCGSVSPQTLWQLRSFGPLSADPQDVAVMLDLPDGLSAMPGSAQLTLSAARSDTGENIFGSFALAANEAGIWQVEEADHPALRDMQALVLDWKTEALEAASGSLSLTLSPCSVGEGPAENALVSAAIQIASDGTFLPLISEASYAEITGNDALEPLPPCP